MLQVRRAHNWAALDVQVARCLTPCLPTTEDRPAFLCLTSMGTRNDRREAHGDFPETVWVEGLYVQLPSRQELGRWPG